jgi:hypothetical protein
MNRKLIHKVITPDYYFENISYDLKWMTGSYKFGINHPENPIFMFSINSFDNYTENKAIIGLNDIDELQNSYSRGVTTISPNGTYIAVADFDFTTVYKRGKNPDQFTKTLNAFTEEPWHSKKFEFTYCNTMIITGSMFSNLKFWSTTTWQVLKELNIKSHFINLIPNTNKLIIYDGTDLVLIDLNTFAIIKRKKCGAITNMKITRDGKELCCIKKYHPHVMIFSGDSIKKIWSMGCNFIRRCIDFEYSNHAKKIYTIYETAFYILDVPSKRPSGKLNLRIGHEEAKYIRILDKDNLLMFTGNGSIYKITL